MFKQTRVLYQYGTSAIPGISSSLGLPCNPHSQKCHLVQTVHVGNSVIAHIRTWVLA